MVKPLFKKKRNDLKDRPKSTVSFNIDSEVKKWIKETGNKHPVMLNLGSGGDEKIGWINHDQVKTPDVQLVFDLNKLPYSVKDESFDIIFMSHVLEHLDEPLRVVKELQRMLKKNGLLIIRVPHYAGNSNWVDITHRRPYSVLTLRSLGEKLWCSHYRMTPFKSVSSRLGFWKYWYYPWNYIIEPLANIQPTYFEVVFANIFPPFEVIYFMRK